MTPQESIQVLNRLKAEIEWDLSLEYQEALDEAIEALEKQIPKKIKMPMDACFICPVCGRRLARWEEYCCWCGQRIER